MEAGSDVFDRYVVAPNRRIRDLLGSLGADLFFHCCGEVTERMVRAFAGLDPAILSLGSSRKLWEDAALVPPSTVLYGNLPSKKFLLDELPREEVRKLARELLARMRAAGRPFILGSECDVLSVPGYHDVILEKVTAFLESPEDEGR
jgi:uroporphyrinogen-III decarboxylase